MNLYTQEKLLTRTAPAKPEILASATVLVPMLNLNVAGDMLQLGGILASGMNTPALANDLQLPHAEPRVVALGIVQVPADQPLATGLDLARSYRALLDFLPSEVEVAGKKVRVDRVVKVARDVPSAVQQAANDEMASLVLFYWKGYAREPKKHTYGRILDAVLKRPPCDVALVRPEGWRDTTRILLPVRGGPAAERALRLALAVAGHLHLPLTVMHNVPTSPTGAVEAEDAAWVEKLGEEPFIIFNEHLGQAQQTAHVSIEQLITAGDDPAVALLTEARPSDLVIMGMGAPAVAIDGKGNGQVDLAPPLTVQVSGEKGPPLLLLRTSKAIDLEGYAAKVRARRVKKHAGDLPFEHWFVENTYYGDEFKDPDEFVKIKKASGLSLSVALLTFNDAKHLYSELTGLKKVLVEMHPIADQIAVIDGGSTDGTPELARSLGFEVYSASEILPGEESLNGRGESWWKSLAVLTGDVIVWLDPKARRFHPTTALSLAGPLLRTPALQLVKALAETHPGVHETRHNGHGPDGGARDEAGAGADIVWGGSRIPGSELGYLARRISVQGLRPSDLLGFTTEQLAALPPRTFIQALCMPLSGVITPFGRDMAARRSTMMSLPVFAGDSLDAGLLLSVAAEYGTKAIAQVELRNAQPAPAPAPSLQNSLDILQVLAARLQDSTMRGVAEVLFNRLEKEIQGSGLPLTENATGPLFEVRVLGPVERPPMREVLEAKAS